PRGPGQTANNRPRPSIGWRTCRESCAERYAPFHAVPWLAFRPTILTLSGGREKERNDRQAMRAARFASPQRVLEDRGAASSQGPGDPKNDRRGTRLRRESARRCAG